MGSNLDALTTVFTEFYYWVTVVFMFLIHVGFCLYEVAASRPQPHTYADEKYHDHSPGQRDILSFWVVDLLVLSRFSIFWRFEYGCRQCQSADLIKHGHTSG